MTRRLEPWERWFIKHRGSELSRLVTRLAEVLLRKGECTADDARAVPLDGDPRIRGGAVRALVALGLASKGEAVKSASDICHHRPIVRFVLLDSNACRGLTQRFQDMVFEGAKRYQVENGQMMNGAMKPYYDDGNGIVIYHGDCREILPRLPKVDLVLTDPPYGISYKHGYSYSNLKAVGSRHFNKVMEGDSEEFDPSFLLPIGKLVLFGANNFANDTAYLYGTTAEFAPYNNDTDILVRAVFPAFAKTRVITLELLLHGTFKQVLMKGLGSYNNDIH